MFKKVITHKGFWKGVFSVGGAFSLLFLLVKWALARFSSDFLSNIKNPIFFFGGIIIAGFIYGFLVTYGKFIKELKEKEKSK
jgi:hypothetical protein